VSVDERVDARVDAREVIETLAAMERSPCSPGELAAANWLAQRFERAGCEARVEDEVARGRYMPTLVGLGVGGVAGALLTLAGHRRSGALVSLLAAAALVDEAQNGPRLLRRAVYPPRATANVVAAPPGAAASPTLVVLAHHDAHQTGRLYDQGLLMALHRLAPDLLGRMKTSLPQWWFGLAGPALTVGAAVTRRPGLAKAALPVLALGTAAAAEVALSPVSPGANDNLSGVAALVTLAELLRERPLPGVRVMLVSCGSEEALQEGIRAFMARHGRELDPATTSFLNLETVGSPRLIMLEAEGPIWMEPYADPSFRDLVARCARETGVVLDRGYRARASTDSVIPSRAGHPTATITSITDWGALANYHLPTDVPENVDHDSVERAARIAYAVAAALQRAR
jgi:Zn-dependent M28 family amino/carboxypeptidase